MKKSCLHKKTARRAGLSAVRFVLSIVTISVVFAVIMPFLPIHGEAEVYKKVLRLHVIAASDTERDQSVKLSVRDAILDVIPSVLDGCGDLDAACAAVCEGSPRLLGAADARLAELGANYGARIEIGSEYYPTREYDGVRLPAGEYTSVRVILGEGEGKNWWCVLFPSLCLSAAKRSAGRASAGESADAGSSGEEYIAAGFTPEQYRTITETDAPRYRIRFRILEMIGELREQFFK
mgnify:CR=1 FL=1